MRQYPIRRSPWALPFLVPLAPGRPVARIDGDMLVVRMGLLGRADIPLEHISAIGRMRWPWWFGVGVRIARGLVAFAGGAGPVVVLDLSQPLRVRAPFGWTTSRIGLGVEDPDALIADLAATRGLDPLPAEVPPA